MVRIRSLAFTGRGAAEDAMARLRDGADFGWLVANAEGQVDKSAPDVLAFDGRPITTDSMPADMQTAIKGAKAGEFRLFAAGDGPFYVLAVQEVLAPTPKAYDEVRDEIAKALYGEKLRKNADEYIAKLRAASRVQIYLEKAP
jgi:parvulin-like peptidyl-prolyl isomerase